MLKPNYSYFCCLLYFIVCWKSANAFIDSCEYLNKSDCDCNVSPIGNKSVWLFCPKVPYLKGIKHKIFIDYFLDYKFLDVYCDFSDNHSFEYIPKVYKYKTNSRDDGNENVTKRIYYAEHLNFGKCFDNHPNHTNNNTNNNIKLHQFLTDLNLNYTQRMVIHSSTYIVFDEQQFFADFNLTLMKYFAFDYIGFNSTQFIHNLTNMKYLNFYNSEVIDFEQINAEENKLEIIKILNTKMLNFNSRNFAKMKILKYFHLINCKLVPDDLTNFDRFATNELVEMRIINSTEDGTNVLRLREGIFDNLVKLEILFVKYENLQELPRNIFRGLSSLRMLDLSHNKLSYLDQDVFENNLQLELVDLRDNEFETINVAIFETLNHLSQIHLERNRLTEFKYNALNQPQLRLINIKNNSLTFANTSGCPIKTTIFNSISVDLQSNLIENLESVACLINNPGIVKLNLTNNKLTEVRFSAIIKSELLRHKHNMALILDSNNITKSDMLHDTMEEENFLSYHNPYFFNLIIDFNDCPIYCENCLNLRSHAYFSNFFHDYGVEIKLNFPNYCRKSLYCDILEFYGGTDLIEFRMCQYMHNMFTKKLIINCENKNLTEIPTMKYFSFIDCNEIEMNFQNNSIKKLYFSYRQNMNFISKITKINLANNSLEDIDLRRRFPIQLNSLDLSNNPKLTKINENTINLLNIIGHKLNVTITNGNQDLCNSFKSMHYDFNLIGMNDCIHYSLKNVVHTMSDNLTPNMDHNPLIMRRKVVYYNADRPRSNYFIENVLHFKLLFIIAISVICIIIIIYLYYKYSMKWREKFLISNRTGNIEMKENLLGDKNDSTSGEK